MNVNKDLQFFSLEKRKAFHNYYFHYSWFLLSRMNFQISKYIRFSKILYNLAFAEIALVDHLIFMLIHIYVFIINFTFMTHFNLLHFY